MALSAQTRKGLMVVVICMLFIAPFVFSWWYLNHADKSDHTTTNYGELIHPARPLPELSVVNTSDANNTRDFQGKWNLVYFIANECDEDCKQTLFSLNQIEQAMGKYSLRVQRVVIALQPAQVKQVLANYPDLWRLQVPADEQAPVVETFKTGINESPADARRIYIVDPLGNLMMQYASDFDPYGILRDLRKLLKSSRIG